MKGYIIDDNEFTIGSFNNDRWSWSMNNELNIYINNPQITHNLLKKLEVVKSKSLPVDPEDLTFSQLLNYKFWDAFLKISERVMNRRKFFKLYFPQAYIQLGQNEEEIYRRKVASYKENIRKVFEDMIADTYI
jgi:phosphatidylserine/phosphatidylglycerophosphate/cardiolipin synthase-like enzyme